MPLPGPPVQGLYHPGPIPFINTEYMIIFRGDVFPTLPDLGV